MKRYAAIVVASILLVPASAGGESDGLKFLKEIGVRFHPGKFGWMSFVAFSPDGTMVASDGPATPDDVSGNLTIWSFPEGKLVKRLPVGRTVLSGDWKYYATDDTVGEMATRNKLISMPDHNFRRTHAFSQDDRYVAESPATKGSGLKIRIVDLASGKQVSAFGNYDAFSLAFSPDGSTVASGHWDLINLWDRASGTRLAALHGFGRYVAGLSFSRDGALLAGSTDFGAIQIWDARSRTKLASVSLEGLDVSTPAFSPDGRLVAAGSYGTGTVWLIDVRSGKVIGRKKVSDLGCGSVAFSPDGRYLITPSTGGLPRDTGGTIRVFEVLSSQ